MKKIETLTNLLEDIALSSYDVKKTRSKLFKLKLLTQKIWSKHHADLIEELAKDNKIILDVDYQMFWYECLGFSRPVPLFRDFKGNTIGCYGSLPSDFNEKCNFHDSYIKNITLNENNNLIINIELDSWESSKQAILTFFEPCKYIFRKINKNKNLVDILSINQEELKPAQIFSATEFPPLNYLLNDYKIEYDPSLIKNRMFCLNGNYDLEYNWEIFVFCEKWELNLS